MILLADFQGLSLFLLWEQEHSLQEMVGVVGQVAAAKVLTRKFAMRIFSQSIRETKYIRN